MWQLGRIQTNLASFDMKQGREFGVVDGRLEVRLGCFICESLLPVRRIVLVDIAHHDAQVPTEIVSILVIRVFRVCSMLLLANLGHIQVIHAVV